MNFSAGLGLIFFWIGIPTFIIALLSFWNIKKIFLSVPLCLVIDFLTHLEDFFYYEARPILIIICCMQALLILFAVTIILFIYNKKNKNRP